MQKALRANRNMNGLPWFQCAPETKRVVASQNRTAFFVTLAQIILNSPAYDDEMDGSAPTYALGLRIQGEGSEPSKP